MDIAEGLSHHISSRFNADLEKVRGDVLVMGGLVEQQLERALTAVTTVNVAQPDLSAIVDRDEHRVDEMERTIDGECSRILATRSPTASDLRLLIVILKLITDLERMGDEAQKIAAIGARLAHQGKVVARPQQLRNLGTLVLTMVRDSLDAFARLDSASAEQVRLRDRDVDDEYEALHRQAITFMMEDPRSIRRTLDLMWLIRSLERVGDHAKNVCEHVIFAAHGTDVRHTFKQQS
jgi:phosphate transport system protein